ncbi:MAG: prolyl oligopeptidase family serine peptidase [Chitinophagaceae bacterium]
MRKLLLIFLSLSSLVAISQAQDFSLYQKKWLVQGVDTLPYRILLPEPYDLNKKYPVLFFLHGAGERGMDNEKQLIHGGALFLQKEARTKFPAIIVFPQCAEKTSWSNVVISTAEGGKRTFNFQEGGEPTKPMAMLENLIQAILYEYSADKNRIYVGGLSMGGMGTYEVVRRHPKLFAAAFPICGGANPATANKLKRPQWWIFHGAKDDIVPYQFSEDMATALKRKRAQVTFTLYPTANHNSWDAAFAEKELLPWLFAAHK